MHEMRYINKDLLTTYLLIYIYIYIYTLYIIPSIRQKGSFLTLTDKYGSSGIETYLGHRFGSIVK